MNSNIKGDSDWEGEGEVEDLNFKKQPMLNHESILMKSQSHRGEMDSLVYP